MNKYFSRVTKSARGENFNPLIWPFLIGTFAYGVGFTFFTSTTAVHESSLFAAMTAVYPAIPEVWGIVALVTILIGLTFLMFRIPPAGKISGLVGFMVWVFATFCWIFSGGWLLVFSVGVPNMYFWVWQYLSLSLFRREDREDVESMRQYDTGQYDDEKNPRQGKIDREDNRGQDIQ